MPPDKENDSPPKNVACLSCDLNFASQELLRQHVRWAHSEVIPVRSDGKGRGRGRNRKSKIDSLDSSGEFIFSIILVYAAR